ncbi:Mitogen-activated protein kinase-binding protein 1 [Cichlidogyrus casuarinus]|uniref:Mitogen-activated protein kinase-binding protein 1 n=1 Tax=Cichlidogyrus casuarinus TaxID=1844966 RepID=A0ABD2PSZ0_9PLAT
MDEKPLRLCYTLGFTSCNNNSIAYNSNLQCFTYLTGCSFVLRSLHSRAQTIFHSMSQRNSLTCIDVSFDGKFVATGESGNNPKVLIYRLEDKIKVLTELDGHKFSINAVKFSPTNSNYLVSVGCALDQNILVWNLLTKSKCYSTRMSQAVNSITFMPSGFCFVTVAIRSIRYFEFNTPSTSKSKSTNVTLLNCHNAILNNYLNFNFVDCASYLDGDAAFVLALASNGHLFKLDENRNICKQIKLDVQLKKAYCLSCDQGYSLVGGQNGHVLIDLFNPGIADSIPNLDNYPAVVGCKLDIDHGYAIGFFSDRRSVFAITSWRLPSNSTQRVVDYLVESGNPSRSN